MGREAMNKGGVACYGGDVVQAIAALDEQALLPRTSGFCHRQMFAADQELLEFRCSMPCVPTLPPKRLKLFLSVPPSKPKSLVVPHLVRLAVGNDQRLLLPASVLAGGSLLILADTAARTIIAPQRKRTTQLGASRRGDCLGNRSGYGALRGLHC